MLKLVATLTAVAATITAQAAQAHQTRKAIHGPADRYVYELAKPGSYELPAIKPAGGGDVLDQTGRTLKLGELLDGKVTILAFIYTRCGDVCPLATMRMAEFRDMAAERPALAQSVRLVTLSFDPDYDTPEVLAAYAEPWRDDGAAAIPWSFLTTSSAEALRPILQAYDQPVAPKADSRDPSGPISHLMRAFLIDRDRQVRNIYSADFLDARLLLNDVLTLVDRD